MDLSHSFIIGINMTENSFNHVIEYVEQIKRIMFDNGNINGYYKCNNFIEYLKHHKNELIYNKDSTEDK